jgi:outer membrane biosynthesis protein TonB
MAPTGTLNLQHPSAMMRTQILIGLATCLCGCVAVVGPSDPYGLPFNPENVLPRIDLRACTPKDVENQPILLSGTRPLYPLGENLTGRPGSANIEFSVLASGQVRVLSAVGSGPYFRDHAEIAMRDWKVVPAKRQGSPIDSVCKIEFKYITYEESQWRKLESNSR